MNTVHDFAFSEQGYNHIKADKVCQDSSGHYSDDTMAVIVVADGHGSDNYPRTERGSSFAVDATITAIREFVATVEESHIDISKDSEAYLEQLAKNILANWYTAVEADLVKYPFSEDELIKVADKYKNRYLSGKRCEKAYGTTLIAACQTKSYWFGIQIGDGKCVRIAPDGSMSEPIPWDDDCEANITTSICDSEAIDEFRYYYTDSLPIATLIGTDGIDDSYASSEELHSLYRSILAIFSEHGYSVGESEVKGFLPNLTKKGSGDDVSIAGLVSLTLSPLFVNVLKAQGEYIAAKSNREKLEREVTLASEKLDYIAAALAKAKSNYELTVQKMTAAEEAIVTVRNAYNEAVKRLEKAAEDLESAKKEQRENMTETAGDKLSQLTEVGRPDADQEYNVDSPSESEDRLDQTDDEHTAFEGVVVTDVV